MDIKRVKVAVVGCGMISHVYLRNLTRLFSIIEVVAVCDLNRALAEKAAHEYGIARVMTADEIAASPDIELVVNLTGPSAHYAVLKQMLLAGKHVYTEKTMTAELWEARELVELAREKRLYIGVAPDTALGASVQTARMAVDSGLIGDVTSCIVAINRNQGLNSEQYRFLRAQGGSLPCDMGVYYLAALLCILGPVAEAVGFAAPAPLYQRQFLFNTDDPESWQIPGGNLVTGALRFKRGTLGTVHFDGNTIDTERPLFRLYGASGILELGDPNRFGDPITLIKPESPPSALPLSHGYNGVCRLPDATDFERGYGNRGIGVAELAWAIRRNRPNRLSGDFGLHTLEVLCGLEQSALSGKAYRMTSEFTIAPLAPGFYSSMHDGRDRADAERSLIM